MNFCCGFFENITIFRKSLISLSAVCPQFLPYMHFTNSTFNLITWNLWLFEVKSWSLDHVNPFLLKIYQAMLQVNNPSTQLIFPMTARPANCSFINKYMLVILYIFRDCRGWYRRHISSIFSSWVVWWQRWDRHIWERSSWWATCSREDQWPFLQCWGNNNTSS